MAVGAARPPGLDISRTAVLRANAAAKQAYGAMDDQLCPAATPYHSSAANDPVYVPADQLTLQRLQPMITRRGSFTHVHMYFNAPTTLAGRYGAALYRLGFTPTGHPVLNLLPESVVFSQEPVGVLRLSLPFTMPVELDCTTPWFLGVTTTVDTPDCVWRGSQSDVIQTALYTLQDMTTADFPRSLNVSDVGPCIVRPFVALRPAGWDYLVE